MDYTSVKTLAEMNRIVSKPFAFYRHANPNQTMVDLLTKIRGKLEALDDDQIM